MEWKWVGKQENQQNEKNCVGLLNLILILDDHKLSTILIL
jgi:hypothetical protein